MKKIINKKRVYGENDMIKIKKIGCFNYAITLVTFLLSINFLVKGNNIEYKTEVKLTPKVNIKTSDTQITPNKAKSIALGHAGVSETAANFKKIKNILYRLLIINYFVPLSQNYNNYYPTTEKLT